MGERPTQTAPIDPERARACLALREKGLSWHKIGAEVGISWISARRYVKRWGAWYEQEKRK